MLKTDEVNMTNNLKPIRQKVDKMVVAEVGDKPVTSDSSCIGKDPTLTPRDPDSYTATRNQQGSYRCQ